MAIAGFLSGVYPTGSNLSTSTYREDGGFVSPVLPNGTKVTATQPTAPSANKKATLTSPDGAYKTVVDVGSDEADKLLRQGWKLGATGRTVVSTSGGKPIIPKSVAQPVVKKTTATGTKQTSSGGTGAFSLGNPTTSDIFTGGAPTSTAKSTTSAILPNQKTNTPITQVATTQTQTPTTQSQQLMNGKPSSVLKPISNEGQTISATPEKEWPLGFVGSMAKAAYDTTKSTLNTAVNSIVKASESLMAADKDTVARAQTNPLAPEYLKTQTTVLQRATAMGQAAVSTANIGFLPVTTQLEAAKELPGPLSLPAKATSYLFEKAGEAGAYALGKTVNLLPISDKDKETIKPLAEEVGAFAAQMIGIKAVHGVAKKGIEIKGLNLTKETKAKISTGAQLTAGLSMTPFTTTYSLGSSLIATKVAERIEKKIPITKVEVKKMETEIKKELPEEVKKEVKKQEEFITTQSNKIKTEKLAEIAQKTDAPTFQKIVETTTAKQFLTQKGTTPQEFYEKAKITETKPSEVVKPEVKPTPQPLAEEAQILRGTKGMTADDIMATYPNIKLKKDVPATDIYGNKVKIQEGEKLTPYELKGNKVLLQDGETYIVSKSQFQNIKGQSVSAEGKPFAPELAGTEESIKTTERFLTEKDLKQVIREKDNFGTERYVVEFNTGQKYIAQPYETKQTALANAYNANIRAKGMNTKYSSYQLPEGKNYKEILIKAPDTKITPEILNKLSQENYSVPYTQLNVQDAKIVSKIADNQYGKMNFKSSHWDEPNVISHLRLNERTYKGKKVTFMEELQSDWAREGRDKGFASGEYDKLDARRRVIEDKGTSATQAEKVEWADIMNKLQKESNAIPSNPLLKNWQELSIKRALKEAVDNKSDYLSWISGEQTSARYNLATYLENVKWEANSAGGKRIYLKAKEKGSSIETSINKNGIIEAAEGTSEHTWVGKKLDEVLGKGLADKIMAQETGTLSGEGLKFGGEWANNLYDKQVKNIVEDLTGAKVEVIDLGLPIDNKLPVFDLIQPSGKRIAKLTPDNLEVGAPVSNAKGDYYIITDVLGDGKFKAVPKSKFTADTSKPFVRNGKKVSMSEFYDPMTETFDISIKKSAGQQAIKITPEIRAKVKGQAPKIKTSGKKFEVPKAPEIQKEIKVKSEAELKAEEELKFNENSKFKSRVYERLQTEYADVLTEKVGYEKSSRDAGIEKAIKNIETDPQDAFDIAMSRKGGVSEVESVYTNITMSEKALDEGNLTLYAKLIKNRSLAQTSRGQAIEAEKASVTDNNTSKYVKELIATRLENLGKKYLGNVKDVIKKTSTAKEKALNTIERKAGELGEKIKNKKLDVKTALDLLEKIKCL